MILYWFRDSCLLCSSLTTKQTKHQHWNPSLLNWLCVSPSLMYYCITSLFMFVQQGHYFIVEYFLKSVLELCKVQIILSSTHSKASGSYFLIASHCHHQPLDCLILTFRSNYDANCLSFSTGTIDLHVDSARIFGCCESCLVILVVPVDLHILSVTSSECKHVMSCICVGQSLISVHSYTTWCIQLTQRCSCSVTFPHNNKLSASCVLWKHFIWVTNVGTRSITSTIFFVPSSSFCFLKYVPSEHKQYQTTHKYDISPHIYIPALLQ